MIHADICSLMDKGGQWAVGKGPFCVPQAKCQKSEIKIYLHPVTCRQSNLYENRQPLAKFFAYNINNDV